MRLKRILPILEWLPFYRKSDFKKDLIAGLSVSVMLVPQGMAYAMLAGMPPIYGLYGGLVPLFLYAIFGTSRQLSIGPVAIVALLILAGISKIAEPFSEAYISFVILTCLMIGLVLIGMSMMRLGFLVNFLSHPVVAGFISAATVIIAINQLKYLLGFEIPRFGHFYETVVYAANHLPETNLPTLFMCLGSILVIFLLKKINRNLPAPLLVVILGIILAKIFLLDANGVEVVGKVPGGLPHFLWPEVSLGNIQKVSPTVFTVALITIVESIGIAKMLESKHRSHRVQPNRELFALGISMFGGAFFQSIPISGSFARSAINDDAGAKTGMATNFAALLVALTLLFLTPLFYFLPKAVLAAIILVVISGLFDYKEAIHLWKTHRRDFLMMMATFITTLAFGIEAGVLAGVVLSLSVVIYRSSTPHVAVLGRLPKTRYYRNITRFPDALQSDEVLIVRFDAQLYFGNVAFFKDTIRELVAKKGESLKLFILDASSIYEMDSTGLNAFEEMLEYLKGKGIELYLSGVLGPVRDMLTKANMMGEIGKQNQFMTIHDAVKYYKKNGGEKKKDLENWSEDALQSNVDD